MSASMENARTDAVELSDEQRERLLDLVRVGSALISVGANGRACCCWQRRGMGTRPWLKSSA